jgi:S-(hydroxymethyl)glutathione dehydrogenase/alcohol dehydrogenase
MRRDRDHRCRRSGPGDRDAPGGARGRTDAPKIVDWYMDRKIDIDSLITDVMPIDRINESFDRVWKGESIRTVVTF